MENIPTLVRAVPEGIEVQQDTATTVLPRRDVAGASWSIGMGLDRSINKVYISDAGAIPSLLEQDSAFRHICGDQCGPETTFYLSDQGRPTATAIARMGNILQTPEAKSVRMGAYDVLGNAAKRVEKKRHDLPEGFNFYDFFMGGDGLPVGDEVNSDFEDDGFEEDIRLQAEEDGLIEIEDFYDDDVIELSDADLRTMLVEERSFDRTDPADIKDMTQVISYDDVTKVVDRNEYDAVRRRLFNMDKMDEKERIRLDYMKDVCEKNFERLGFVVEKNDIMGRYGFMIKQVDKKSSGGLCVPDFILKNALKATESVDAAFARYENLRRRQIPKMNTVVKSVQEIINSGRSTREQSIDARNIIDREISDLVSEAKSCFSNLLEARGNASRYFVRDAARETDSQIRSGLDMLSLMLLGDAVTGSLDAETTEQLFQYMSFENGLSSKIAAAKEYGQLRNEGTFKSLNEARRIAQREFSGEYFFDDMIAQLDTRTKTLAYRKVADAIADNRQSADNLLRVYSASGNKHLNEVAHHGKHIQRQLDAGGWEDLRQVRSFISKYMTDGAKQKMLEVVDSRIHDVVYGLAEPVANGSSASKGLVYSQDEKLRMYSDLISARTSDHATRALCIADRYLPKLREPAMKHLGTCLERELSESEDCFVDHREKVAGLLDDLEGMHNKPRREKAQHYVHLIAQSYMHGGRPKLVGSDPAQNKATILGIPAAKVSRQRYEAGAA